MGIQVDDPNARGEKQKDVTDAYRKNWDRIFKKTPSLEGEETKSSPVLRVPVPDNKPEDRADVPGEEAILPVSEEKGGGRK